MVVWFVFMELSDYFVILSEFEVKYELIGYCGCCVVYGIVCIDVVLL